MKKINNAFLLIEGQNNTILKQSIKNAYQMSDNRLFAHKNGVYTCITDVLTGRMITQFKCKLNQIQDLWNRNYKLQEAYEHCLNTEYYKKLIKTSKQAEWSK